MHFKSCKKNVHSSESVVYWPRYRALCTCTSPLHQRRPVWVLRLKRLYIGTYGTFKFKWSYYISRYVWIDNFHGNLLVSTIVWIKCYTAVWRTIYSSKFAFFGKYIDANLMQWNNLHHFFTHDCNNDYTAIWYIENRAIRMFIHQNRLYSGRDIELYALVPQSYLLQLKRRPVLGLTLKRLYIGAYGTFKLKLSCIFRYVWIDNFHG